MHGGRRVGRLSAAGLVESLNAGPFPLRTTEEKRAYHRHIMRFSLLLLGALLWVSPQRALATHPCFEDAGPCDCCHGRFDCPPECFPDASGASGGRSGSGGTGGSPTGGSSGTSSGGTLGSSSGGSSGSGTGAGGTLGSSGSSSGSGGAAGFSGTAAAGTGASSGAEDEGGCGCSVPGTESTAAWLSMSLLFGVLALRRQRRRCSATHVESGEVTSGPK